MKIISSDVDWHEGWANRANLVVTVDRVPSFDEGSYIELKRGIGGLYWSDNDGMVHFFAHDKYNESGYGGREFTIQLENGDAKTIKGPWSSRASAMNNHFPHSVDVTLIELDGHGRFAGAITLELAQQAAEMAGVKLVKVEDEDDTDIRYEIHRLLSHPSEMTDPEANA